MLNHISWGSYLFALCILLVCYYSYVFWLYRKTFFAKVLTEAPILPVSNDDLHPQAESCSRELSAYLDQLSYSTPSKPELLFGVQKLIQKYPALAGTTYQSAISKLIGFETKSKCSIHLSEEEMRQVWLV